MGRAERPAGTPSSLGQFKGKNQGGSFRETFLISPILLSRLRWHCHFLLVLQRETALLGLLVELMVTVSVYDLLVFDKVIQKQIKLTLKIHFRTVKILDKLIFFHTFYRPFSRVEEKLRYVILTSHGMSLRSCVCAET